MKAPVPVGLLAELTHRCPLGCPYCSNPLALEKVTDELDTATWAYGADAPPSPSSAPCYATARILSSAGWQVGIARCGDSVAGVWRSLLAYRSVSSAARSSALKTRSGPSAPSCRSPSRRKRAARWQ